METRSEGFHTTEMRAGNIDRDDCASYLVEHYLEGRLSTEELERRERAASVAVTMAELRALFADLPGDAAQRLGRRSPKTARPPAARTRADWWEKLPRRHLWSVTKTVTPPATVILASASYSQSMWEFSSEGAFFGALFTGTLAYAAGVVSTHLGHRRSRRASATAPNRADAASH